MFGSSAVHMLWYPFTFNKKLWSATLAPTMITLNVDGTRRTIAVARTKQGVADLPSI